MQKLRYRNTKDCILGVASTFFGKGLRGGGERGGGGEDTDRVGTESGSGCLRRAGGAAVVILLWAKEDVLVVCGIQLVGVRTALSCCV